MTASSKNTNHREDGNCDVTDDNRRVQIGGFRKRSYDHVIDSGTSASSTVGVPVLEDRCGADGAGARGDGSGGDSACGAGAVSESKKKKARTTFSGKQIYELERKFEAKKYLTATERSDLATLLHVTETQVSAANVYVSVSTPMIAE